MSVISCSNDLEYENERVKDTNNKLSTEVTSLNDSILNLHEKIRGYSEYYFVEGVQNVRNGDFARAMYNFKILKDSFPNSPYVSEANIFISEIHAHQVETVLEILKRAKGRDIDSLVRDSILESFSNNFKNLELYRVFIDCIKPSLMTQIEHYTVEEILEVFDLNSVNALEKFNGKTIYLSGVIEDTYKVPINDIADDLLGSFIDDQIERIKKDTNECEAMKKVKIDRIKNDQILTAFLTLKGNKVDNKVWIWTTYKSISSVVRKGEYLTFRGTVENFGKFRAYLVAIFGEKKVNSFFPKMGNSDVFLISNDIVDKGDNEYLIMLESDYISKFIFPSLKEKEELYELLYDGISTMK